MEWVVATMGLALGWMGAQYLFKSQDLGSFNPRALERSPVVPAETLGADSNPYKQIPEAKIIGKDKGLRYTRAAPPKFF